MDTIELENNVKLDRLLTTNPEMEKKVRNIIRQVMKGAQGALMKSAEQYSTKQAYKAVRKAVYKKLLGGNVNILQGRGRAGQRAPLPPVRHRGQGACNHGRQRCQAQEEKQVDGPPGGSPEDAATAAKATQRRLQ